MKEKSIKIVSDKEFKDNESNRQNRLILADIRTAVGDSSGRLTQEELVQRIHSIVFSLGTAMVLAERSLMPGPQLIKEWRSYCPTTDCFYDEGWYANSGDIEFGECPYGNDTDGEFGWKKGWKAREKLKGESK